MKPVFGFVFCLVLPLCAFAQNRPSPYAGQQSRDIKALSDEEIQGYSKGQGMALAKAAELNHYPGPLHVLEFAQQLQLTESQKLQTEKIRAAMSKEAMALGARIVEREKELDALFAGAKIDEVKLRTSISEIARLQGDLRVAHLRAHLEQKKILTPEQVAKYDELRGYASAAGRHEGHR
jgi:Spy/CpxP family protein refolding chaperone